MKKQSSRAKAQSTPPVRHQLEHAVPTVIHNPEENMTALGRWANHAMKEPSRYMGWPLAIIGVVLVLAIVPRLVTGGSSGEADVWKKLEAAKTPVERVDLAKANPKSAASTWGRLQAATEFFSQALGELPKERDAAVTALKKAQELFDEVLRDAPHDSPQARVAALGKGRVLEMRGDLPKAIEQYELVAKDKDWSQTAEGAEARQFAEALKDPQAVAFYKELYAFEPAKLTLPPGGTETILPPGLGSPLTLPPGAGSTESPLPGQAPMLSPGIGAIPGLREVIEPKSAAPAKTTPPKATAPDAKAQTAPPKASAPDAKGQPAPPKAVAPDTKTQATPKAAAPVAKVQSAPPKAKESTSNAPSPKDGESKSKSPK